MAVVTTKQLLHAGVHFGHQTRRWNPKMARHIHGERGGIHIIDLEQTLTAIERSYAFVRDLVADGGTIMFIGTKKQAQGSIRSHAERSGMPYVNERWLGGMLTNFNTISKRVSKMQEYQRMRDSGEFEAMPKKEALLISRELAKLERNLSGIASLDSRPDAVFILDTKREHIAVTEANKLGLPIVAVVDTNCDPDTIRYPIPGNDDAIRATELMARVIGDAASEGRFISSKRADFVPPRTPEEEAAAEAEQAKAREQAAQEAAQREARIAATMQAAEAPPSPEQAQPAEPALSAEPEETFEAAATPESTPDTTEVPAAPVDEGDGAVAGSDDRPPPPAGDEQVTPAENEDEESNKGTEGLSSNDQAEPTSAADTAGDVSSSAEGQADSEEKN